MGRVVNATAIGKFQPRKAEKGSLIVDRRAFFLSCEATAR
jgi:hypothetical protein